MYGQISACGYVYIYISVCVHVCVYMSVGVCVCVCVCVCVGLCALYNVICPCLIVAEFLHYGAQCFHVPTVQHDGICTAQSRLEEVHTFAVFVVRDTTHPAIVW